MTIRVNGRSGAAAFLSAASVGHAANRETNASALARIKRRARLIAQMFGDLFRGENANGVPRGIEHVIPAGVRTHRDSDADAVAFGIFNQSDDFLELASRREAL